MAIKKAFILILYYKFSLQKIYKNEKLKSLQINK